MAPTDSYLSRELQSGLGDSAFLSQQNIPDAHIFKSLTATFFEEVVEKLFNWNDNCFNFYEKRCQNNFDFA